MPNTVILKWNPAISSYGMINFLEAIIQEENEFNWSVWDYEKIHRGDIAYMLKVGQGQTGIVKHGVVTSEPYRSGDWSGRGRIVYYCDFKADIMLSPDTFPILSSSSLEDGIPGFDWNGGHSGLILDAKQAEVLKRMWDAYLDETKAEFQSRLELIERRGMYNDQIFITQKLRKQLFTASEEGKS